MIANQTNILAPFITFEGIDGSGKSVQAEQLAGNLKENGYRVSLFREPGDTQLSEQIRTLLLDKSNSRMHALTELFLYEAARAQLLAEKIRPALSDGTVVICDRFADSTTAYQGYGRELPIGTISEMNRFACGDTLPDRKLVISAQRTSHAQRFLQLLPQLLLSLPIKAADRALYVHLIGDDVAGLAGPDVAKRDDGRTHGVDAACANAVNRVDHLGQDEDGIDALLG